MITLEELNNLNDQERMYYLLCVHLQLAVFNAFHKILDAGWDYQYVKTMTVDEVITTANCIL
jgi:hypothetical protein